jgi:hypothetical protein
VLHYLSFSLFLVLVQSKEEKDTAACKTQQNIVTSEIDYHDSFLNYLLSL